jgi:hypothetical protein
LTSDVAPAVKVSDNDSTVTYTVRFDEAVQGLNSLARVQL